VDLMEEVFGVDWIIVAHPVTGLMKAINDPSRFTDRREIYH